MGLETFRLRETLGSAASTDHARCRSCPTFVLSALFSTHEEGVSLSFPFVWIINPQWDKIYVVQYRERGERAIKISKTLASVWLFMTKRSETISIVIENLMFQKCAEAPETTLAEQKSSPAEEWMNFLCAPFCTTPDTILRSCRRQRRWYLEHERNIYKLFPFISISIPFIMWQVSAFLFFRTL